VATSNASLSDDELTRLDDQLSSADNDTLGIDEAHGYTTALIVSSRPIEQEKWLEAILGNANAADELVGLLIHMRNNIHAALDSGERFEPMIIEEEIDGELFETYEGWCFGFILAITQHQEQWDQLPANKEELLAPIAQLALLYSDDEMDMDDEEYGDCVELLPGSVTTLHDYWKASTEK